jgi:D-inositol-3-phosphate glycosyltransferase
MRIAIVEPVGAYGGMEIYDLSLVDGLGKYCECVHLYTSDYFTEPELVKKSSVRPIFGKIYDKDRPLIYRQFMLLFGLIRLLLSISFGRYNIKYCHVFTYSLLELSVIVASFVTPGRLFINVHDPKPFMDKSNSRIKRVFAKIFEHSKTRLVTHSEYSRAVLLDNFKGVPVIVMPHTDIDWIYQGVDVLKDESKERLSLSLQNKYILFFGQIKENKGLDLLLKAFVDLSGCGYKLLIAGRCWGAEWGRYQKIIDERCIHKDVVVHNRFISPIEVHNYFNACEFVVLPYTEIFSSGVLIRAMGYGKPVVCPDLPAFLESVVDQENGILYKKGSTDALIKSLNMIVKSPNLVRDMTSKVIDIYSKKYDRFTVSEQMMSIFKND